MELRRKREKSNIKTRDVIKYTFLYLFSPKKLKSQLLYDMEKQDIASNSKFHKENPYDKVDENRYGLL